MAADNAHQFALYVESLTKFLETAKSCFIELKDEAIIHRIIHVLRLTANDHVTLFDSALHASVLLKTIQKKSVGLEIINTQKNQSYTPHITFFFPLLKKDAFEAALYNLTALGVQIIQIYACTKTASFASYSHERAQRIMIAAAEQSKQFIIPEIRHAVTYSKLLQTHVAQSFFFADQQGMHAYETITTLKSQNRTALTLMVGPEGDLTTAEKQDIASHATLLRLTPTILRSEDALSLMTGMIRALFS